SAIAKTTISETTPTIALFFPTRCARNGCWSRNRARDSPSITLRHCSSAARRRQRSGEELMAGSVQRYFAGLSRNTFLLAAASLFADISTEMLYPVLPVFLTQTLKA